MNQNPYESPRIAADDQPPKKQSISWLVRYPIAIIAAMGFIAAGVELDFGIRVKLGKNFVLTPRNFFGFATLFIAFISAGAISVYFFGGDRLKILTCIGIALLVGLLVISLMMLR